MRILMLDNEFPPLGGGMGTANEAVLQRYAKRHDLEIDLITSALGGKREIEQFAEHIRIVKVPVWNRNIHHSTNRELLIYAFQALPIAFRYHYARPYDICFAWSTVPAGAVAFALRRFLALPYVIWVSGPDIPGFEHRYWRIYPLLSPLIRNVWRHAESVVAKCIEEKKMIHTVDTDIDPKIIPNGVDLNTFQPGPPIPDQGPLRVICVARLIQRKGQHHLIQAVKRLADEGIDVVLSLVGTGDSQPDYESLVYSLGIATRVRFLGYVPREKIASHYAAAHVFVLPSFNEGMSIAALEAMASGLPVILTRTGGTEELVQEGENGLTFDWSDIDKLVAHLRSLATNRTLARHMGAASRARALHFSWDYISDRFLDLVRLRCLVPAA